MAEVPSSTRVPVPDELRPYFVLETEPETAPIQSRFEGWWAAVWLSALPCVQIGRGDSPAVGRALTLDEESDPAVRRSALHDASFFVTTRESSLEEALEAGTRTIWVPDPSNDEEERAPRILDRFAEDQLCVVEPATAFRRDLTLQSLQFAFERFAPGILKRDVGESVRCRERLRPFLNGEVADIGHGGCKILPDATGVDFFRYDADDWIGDARDLHFFGDQSFDSVYSSHCLEDLWDPRQALEEWLRILKIGGHLCLYLPLRDFYPNVGTPGANPGHKDDYVPEDVVGFLGDLGSEVEILESERYEDEDSFQVIVRKKSGKSFYLTERGNMRPTVSVLILGEHGDQPDLEARALGTTIVSAEASIAGQSHETIVLLRQRPSPDALAHVRELATRYRSVRLVEDYTPMSYPARVARIAREARAHHTIVLESGAFVFGDALSRMLAAARMHDCPVRARVIDASGCALEPHDSVTTAICLETVHLTEAAQSPYCTPRFWSAIANDLTPIHESSGMILGSGLARRPESGLTNAQLEFDEKLLERGVAATTQDANRVLVAILRTFGDAVLATSTVDGLKRRWPEASIDVVTESTYAWIFETNPNVDRVLISESSTADRAIEEVVLHTALTTDVYDRYVVLSPRLDNTAYHDAGGIRLAGYYARLAGVADAGRLPPTLALPEDTLDVGRRTLESLGVEGDYAVVHTKAGWKSKSLSENQAFEIVDTLAGRGLTVVIVGGPGELVAHPRALNLAGMIPADVSAAIVANARVFVGPDSGCLHVASAFGVPALALYAGSHPWVAPPLAHASESLLSPTSCARPCGNACADGHCGLHGIGTADLTNAIHRLVDRASDNTNSEASPIEHATLCADARVTWIQTPLGPQRCTGKQATTEVVDLATSTARNVEQATHRAERHDIAIDLQHLDAIRARIDSVRTVRGPQLHSAALLESALDRIERRARIDTFITIASHAVAIRDTSLAHSWLERTALWIAAAIRGENGRPRPAYKAWLDDVFMLLVTIPHDDDCINHAFEFWDDQIGTRPPRHGLMFMQRAKIESCSEDTKERLAHHFCALDESDLSLADVRRCAAGLRRFGENEASHALLTQRLSRAVKPAHRGNLAWDRALAILDDPARIDELRDDLQTAARLSSTPSARVLARRLLNAMPAPEVQLA